MLRATTLRYRAVGLLLWGAATASAQGTLSIANSSLLKGIARVPYSQIVSASGGNQPYSWVINAGIIPPGLAINASTGVISGTPATAGSYRFTAQVTDVLNARASTTFLLEIVQQVQPALNNGELLPDAVSGKQYNYTLLASGGTPPYTWRPLSGFPQGISINTTGLISGLTSTSGSFIPLIIVQDSGTYGSVCCTGKSVTASYELKVTVPMAINAASPPNATTNVAYSTVFSATGRGADSGFRWTIINGALPDGLSLVTNGPVIGPNPAPSNAITIAGTPSRAGQFTFTLQAANSFNEAAIFAATIRVAAPFVFPASTLPGGGVNIPYSQPLLYSGGFSPYVWTVSPAAFVPGLTIEPATGVIRGTPTTAGTYVFTVTLTDGSGLGQSQQLQIVVAPPIGSVIVSTSGLNFSWQIGATIPTAQTITFSTTNPALTPSVSSNSDAVGVSISAGSIVVTPKPLGLPPGSYPASLSITTPGAANNSITIPVAITVLAAPAIAAAPASLAFTSQISGSAPPAQSIILSSTPAASITASSSAAWLQISLSGPNTAAIATISAQTAGMAVGTYLAEVTISVPGSNSKLIIPVSLRITGAPTIASGAGQLSFTFQAGGALPVAQSFSVSATSTAAVTITTNAAWLSAATSSATTPANVSASINPAGLAAGVYTGNITITAAGASNSPLNVPVTLTVTVPNSVAASPQIFNFTFQPNESSPQTQPLTLAATVPVGFTLASNAAWLTASVASGTTPAAMNITATPGTLAAGTYSATLSVSSPGAVNSPLSIAVSMTIRSVVTLTVLPGQLSFSGAVLEAQTVLLTSSQPTSFSVSTLGTDWVYALPSASSTPATITVNASAAGLAPGTYNGNIIITAPGASNSPKLIAVSLTVAASAVPQLTVNPAQLAFTQESSAAVIPAQTLAISSLQPVPFTVAAAPDAWLSAVASGSSTPATITVTANPKNLAVGNYNSSIAITAGAVTQTVPVTLAVAASSPPLSIPTTQLAFTVKPGNILPPPQVVRLTSPAPTNYTATTSGEPWLILDAGTRVTPGALTVSIKTAGLTDGSYTGSITVVAATAASKPQTISVSLTILAPEFPSFSAAGIVNAANYLAGMVPGSLVTLFGKNLSTVNGIVNSVGRTFESGTSVRVGGILAPLLAVVNQQGQEQISFQVPFDLNSNSTSVEVITKFGSLSLPAVPLLVAQPGIFELRDKPDGLAPAAAIHTDGRIISVTAPAKLNEIVSLFFTGAGSVRPAVGTGRLGPVPPAIMALPLSVLLNDETCEVLFAGYAPASLGLFQVNFRIPPSIKTISPAKLSLRVNGVFSQTTELSVQ